VAAYPVLALLAWNIEEVQASTAIRALILSLVLALILMGLTRWLLKDRFKAGLITSISLVLFYSYGHLYGAIKHVPAVGILVGRHRLLTPLFLIIWLLLVWWVIRQQRDLLPLTRTLNLIAAVALIFPLASLIAYQIKVMNSPPPAMNGQTQPASSTFQGEKPDIYYIILDGYSRDDALLKHLDYDNSDFLAELEALGFYVARCSASNYAQTQLSLSSSLSMDYLQALDPKYNDPQNHSRANLPAMIHESAVRQYLAGLGYQTVAFNSGFFWTTIEDADIFLEAGGRSAKYLGLLSGTNDFEDMLIKTSGGLLLTDANTKLPEFLDIENNRRRAHRQRVLFTLDQLQEIPDLPGHKFVFAHIVSPHAPFIFGPDGEPVPVGVDKQEGYLNQVKFMNNKLLPVLKNIIDKSDSPPIILLQADHGGVIGNQVTRMQILNAYYLPDGGDQRLYDRISPVNTFRLVFDHYFDANYTLLPDTSYFSSYQEPYQFTLIPETRTDCREPR